MPLKSIVSAELPVQLKTTNYTLLASDVGTEVQFESASAVTGNLPAVESAGNGYNVILRNVGTGTLTIDPAGSEQIDGGNTIVLTADEWCWIRSDGTAWKSIAKDTPSSVANGKVLQAVNAIKSDAFTTTNTSYTTITGLSQSITLNSASNKVLVMATVAGSVGANAPRTAFMRLRRDTTDIFIGGSAGNRERCTGGPSGSISSSDSEGIGLRPVSTFAFNGLDIPGSVGPFTYDIQTKAPAASQTVYVNRGIVDTDDSLSFRCSSSLVLMEIAA